MKSVLLTYSRTHYQIRLTECLFINTLGNQPVEETRCKNRYKYKKRNEAHQKDVHKCVL